MQHQRESLVHGPEWTHMLYWKPHLAEDDDHMGQMTLRLALSHQSGSMYVCLSSLLWNGDVPGAPVWTCWTGNWPQNMYPEWIKKIISLTNPVLLDFQLCFPLRFFGSIPFDEFQSVTIHDAQAGLGWICFCCTVTVNEDRKDRIIIERKLQRLALRYWDRNSV